jgi:DNA-binding MarR family transcriptional regulator
VLVRTDGALRLGELLKQAQARLQELLRETLKPYGIDGRELALLGLLADEAPLSQQQAARGLGIDRTTMVSLVDGLEGKGLVRRRAHPEDRRRNMVELTDEGHRTRDLAASAAVAAEERFMAPLAEGDVRRLREMLGLLTEDG